VSEFAEEVRRRAFGRCEYCHLPQSAFPRPFHIEHIVAKQHGGQSRFDNLALACWNCSLKKGPNLSGIDPMNSTVAALFNPRKDKWDEHFSASSRELMPPGVAIRGLTGWTGHGPSAWAERRNATTYSLRTLHRGALPGCDCVRCSTNRISYAFPL